MTFSSHFVVVETVYLYCLYQASILPLDHRCFTPSWLKCFNFKQHFSSSNSQWTGFQPVKFLSTDLCRGSNDLVVFKQEWSCFLSIFILIFDWLTKITSPPYPPSRHRPPHSNHQTICKKAGDFANIIMGNGQLLLIKTNNTNPPPPPHPLLEEKRKQKEGEKKACIDRESNPGHPRGRRVFYH